MGKLIFILEDNDDLRALYFSILEDEDYQIISFATISDFREQVHIVPDLYLLDIMLPDGNGMDLCQELKKNLLTANVPVILISAHRNFEDVKKRCPEADFIAKPFDIEVFTKRIAEKF